MKTVLIGLFLTLAVANSASAWTMHGKVFHCVKHTSKAVYHGVKHVPHAMWFVVKHV